MPLVVAAVGLTGSLAATLFLHGAAQRSLDRALEERLAGAGESAARLLEGDAPTAAQLGALVSVNALEDALVLDRSLTIVADARGEPGRRADLLRVDPARIARAFAGEQSVGASYALGDAVVSTGYFPLRGRDGAVAGVLALEAGQAFGAARTGLGSALGTGVGLSVLVALALAVLAARWARAERARAESEAAAARGETVSRMAAMAAHEIRNPLGIIRGSVELMLERGGAALAERDRAALQDVLDEVARLRGLTEDFLDLAADRPLASARLDLLQLLEEAAKSTEAAFPGVRVRRRFAGLPEVEGDPGRLRQVFTNLLANAAQAQAEGEIDLRAERRGAEICVQVHDSGPGIPPEVRARLFDPFVTGKSGGTGLGLAISRRLVDRHKGALGLVLDGLPGTTFEVRLPVAG